MRLWNALKSEIRLFHARGAQAIIPTALTIIVSSLALTLVAVIIARSPYTHSNLSAGGYNRTEIIRVGEDHPFSGMPLIDPALARTGSDIKDGRTLFLQFGCATCHGLNGTGGAVGPNLRTATAAEIIAQVRSGPKSMPAFPTEVVSDSDLAKVVAFLTGQQVP
jgi:cytochrome c553